MDAFRRIVDIGTGRPVVLLHGWSTNAEFFAPQHALTRYGLRVIVPDLPGHGRDQRAGERLAIADLSAVLAAYLSTARLDGAVLVGWSMGATVALDHLAKRGTAGVAGLVIVDMSPRVANDPDWTLGLRGGRTAAEMLRAAVRMEADWSAYADRVTAALFAPTTRPDDPLYRRVAAAVAANDGVAMASLWRSLVVADHRATVASLDIPVLAVSGAESRLYARDVADWIAAHAPHGRTAPIAGAGHAPQLEAPETFNAAIAAFVKEPR